MSGTLAGPGGLDELRQRKDLFDNTWMLAIVLAVMSVVVFWYLGLGQVDAAPVIWTLAALALLQYLSGTHTASTASTRHLQRAALISQSLGIVGMGVAWHLFGGIQQPLFPLFIMLPLFTGALVLNFWQQQMALFALLAVLLSGVLLSPDTNSFIEERYGLGLASARWLPDWIPHSRVAFTDVSTSPTYNLLLTASLAVFAVALSATSRAIIALSWRLIDRVHTLQDEVDHTRQVNASLVTNAPACEVLVTAGTGRILQASAQFEREFAGSVAAEGQFLLDAIAFAYPVVIKRLMTMGGEEIQGATVEGREVILRVRAGVMQAGKSPVVRMSVEHCNDIGWRGALDALDQPLFVINSRGNVVFFNRRATDLFGSAAEAAEAQDLFDSGTKARWWDIAPLESARRVLDRDGRQYLASIRRERVVESIGEFCFVHLHERETVDALAAS